MNAFKLFFCYINLQRIIFNIHPKLKFYENIYPPPIHLKVAF